MACMVERIAGNCVPVARNRHHGRQMLVTVEVTDQTADPALKRRNARPLRHQRAHFSHANVHRNVLAQQFRRDAQINVIGNEVRGMIGNDQNAPELRDTNDPIGLAHRNAPAKVHHPAGMAA